MVVVQGGVHARNRFSARWFIYPQAKLKMKLIEKKKQELRKCIEGGNNNKSGTFVQRKLRAWVNCASQNGEKEIVCYSCLFSEVVAVSSISMSALTIVLQLLYNRKNTHALKIPAHFFLFFCYSNDLNMLINFCCKRMERKKRKLEVCIIKLKIFSFIIIFCCSLSNTHFSFKAVLKSLAQQRRT